MNNLPNYIPPEPWMPINSSYDHGPEFIVESLLNQYFLYANKKMRAIRNEDHYAPDIDIFEFNTETMKEGKKIRIVEIEMKSKKYEFKNYPDPDWPEWSFLHRKVKRKNIFKDDDIYLLCNYKKCDKIYWTRFGDIRKKCTIYKRLPNEKEWYWRKKVEDLFDFEFVSFGYESLTGYLERFLFISKGL